MRFEGGRGLPFAAFGLLVAVLAAGQASRDPLLVAAVARYEAGDVDARNAHFIPWETMRGTYEVFLAVGEAGQADPDAETMGGLVGEGRLRKWSDAVVDPADGAVRDKASGSRGEILWVQGISIRGGDEADVSAQVITASWCVTAVMFGCRKVDGQWRVASRSMEWRRCQSPRAASP